jgi:hypothetical protein
MLNGIGPVNIQQPSRKKKQRSIIWVTDIQPLIPWRMQNVHG